MIKAKRVTFYGIVSNKNVVHTTTARRMYHWIKRRMHEITMGKSCIVWDDFPDDKWILREIMIDPDGTEWIRYEHYLLS